MKKKKKNNGTTFTCHRRVEYDRVIITSDLTRPFQMDSVGYIILLLYRVERSVVGTLVSARIRSNLP